MIPEEKQLLLKDLCARLPYGVKAKVDGHVNPLQVLSISKLNKSTWAWRKGTWVASFWDDSKSIEQVIPYLRPMSSMTEEELKEFRACSCVYDLHPNFHPMMCNIANELNMFDWLNAHHFDYRSLIRRGLALEAPNGMYKTE